ncbi:MAG: hypothetical protein KDA91_16335, partial [Planctomycetaceae bacterium]|nr:hypothetical protein [Planctomycetaceae bacterium]
SGRCQSDRCDHGAGTGEKPHRRKLRNTVTGFAITLAAEALHCGRHGTVRTVLKLAMSIK